MIPPRDHHVPSFGIFWLDRPWVHSRSAPHFKFISFNSHQLSLIPFEQVTPSHSHNSLVLLTRPPLVCPTTMPPTPCPIQPAKKSPALPRPLRTLPPTSVAPSFICLLIQVPAHLASSPPAGADVTWTTRLSWLTPLYSECLGLTSNTAPRPIPPSRCTRLCVVGHSPQSCFLAPQASTWALATFKSPLITDGANWG